MKYPCRILSGPALRGLQSPVRALPGSPLLIRQDLRQALLPQAGRFFSPYDERRDMNGDSPATKHDLDELRSEVEQLRSVVELGRSEANHVHDDLVERMSDTETRLLQAFYSFAESNNKRLVQGEAATALVISRMTTLESRVLELEKRLDIPPQ